MASLELYNAPLCEEGGCSARVTRKVRTAAGTFHLYCSKHAGAALIAQTRKEDEAERAAQKPQAVRNA